MTLEMIKDELTTRNIIAWAVETRYAVNCVRTNPGEYVVMVTLNGRVIAEKCYVGRESLPRLKEINRLREVFNCERV
jgi:hypothetical protein